MGAVQTPGQILDERYAKGDLTTEEYLERVKHLGPAYRPAQAADPLKVFLYTPRGYIVGT